MNYSLTQKKQPLLQNNTEKILPNIIGMKSKSTQEDSCKQSERHKLSLFLIHFWNK